MIKNIGLLNAGSRMQLLKRIVILTALASALLAAGCSKVTTQATMPSSGNSWTKHGLLRMAELAEPDNLNPVVGNQGVDVDVSMFWAGYLFLWSDQNQWVPELATEKPTLENGGISKDGLRITYHLRRGVKWQDGAPFTADDVIYTWQQVMNLKNNIGSRSGYDLISRIDKLDDYTIAVRLKQRYAPFIAAFFSMGPTPYCVLPKHLLFKYDDINRVPYNNLPVGTGPFKVEKYEKGSLIKFVPNPHYWRGAPKLKEIVIRFIPDQSTIFTQLRTHEIDMQVASDPGLVPSLRTIPGVRVYITPFTSFAQLGLNLNNPILSDRTVRRALAYAVDKQTIINKAAHGVPSPADSDQPSFLWAHNPNVKHYAYDPQLAGKMLEADGWKLASDGYRYRNGHRLQLQMVSNTGGGVAAVIEAIVQQEWRQIGVDASIKEYATPLLFGTYGAGGIFQTGKFDVGFFAWANGVDPDDGTEWMCDQFPPQGQNLYHFCNQELDRAERIALTEYDQATRKAAYDKIQGILANEEPAIIIWFLNRVGVANSDLKNYKPAHAVTTMWNTWEWEI